MEPNTDLNLNKKKQEEKFMKIKQAYAMIEIYWIIFMKMER